MNEDACENCKFWMANSINKMLGDCRRHAPVLVVNQEEPEFPETQWPETSMAAYCGDFEKKVVG